MTRRLVLTYLTITAFALVVVVIPLGATVSAREREHLVFALERDAAAVAARVEEPLEAGRPPAVTPLLRSYRATGGRIVVVAADGRSVADSDHLGAAPRSFASRPEVAAALRGRRSTGSRWSKTLRQRLVYVAVPVASGGVVHGVVRITLPTSVVDARTRSTWLRLSLLSASVLATVAAVGIVLARSVTRPVRELEHAAEALAHGDLRARADLDAGAPELRRLGATFDATAERLEQLVEVQRRFVSDASHQLRTPLTALRLRLETMRSDDPDGAARIDAAFAETQRLSRLVESLLELARADAAEPAVREVDLAELVRDRAAVWEAVAAEQEVALFVDAPASVPVRSTDGAVEQILDNLLANALDVSAAGSTIWLRATPTPMASGAELHVVDQGPGMSDEQRAVAFERFWRPAGSNGGGFGLGLAIVERLAAQAGGEARLDAGPGGVGLDAVVRFAGTEA